MPYKPYVLKVENLFDEGIINWDSPINSIPYIGNGLTAKLQDAGVFRLQDVVHEIEAVLELAPANADPGAVIFNTIAGWVTNSRAHSCVNGQYLPRHFNRMGFNVLIDLLAVANSPNIPLTPMQLLNLGICQWNENHNGLAPDGLQPNRPLCNKVANYGNVGDEPAVTAMRSCPCRNQMQCNGACVWDGNTCLSRVSSSQRRNYARDVDPFGGDWQQVARPLRPNTRRVGPPPGEVGWWYAIRNPDEQEDNDDNEYDNEEPDDDDEEQEEQEEQEELEEEEEEEDDEEEEPAPRARRRTTPLRRSARIERKYPRRNPPRRVSSRR